MAEIRIGYYEGTQLISEPMFWHGIAYGLAIKIQSCAMFPLPHSNFLSSYAILAAWTRLIHRLVEALGVPDYGNGFEIRFSEDWKMVPKMMDAPYPGFFASNLVFLSNPVIFIVLTVFIGETYYICIAIRLFG
jgi:hypothetical protein